MEDSPASAQGVDGPAHAHEEDGEDEGSGQNLESQFPAEKRAEGSNLKLIRLLFPLCFKERLRENTFFS